ncbi:hypothetical protein [Propionibacterium sp.]|uniref:hypothetical protein n=1 Tax=Propionibacterium sp. TaxID=1977903 RepID=UPI0039E7D7EE
MIEKASGDGRLERRLRQVSASRRGTTDHRLAIVWRSAVAALAVVTVGLLWQRAGGAASHIVLIGAAAAAFVAITASRHFDEDPTFERAEDLLNSDHETPAVDNSLGDASALYEIRRRPASQITWVSLAKSPVRRH